MSKIASQDNIAMNALYKRELRAGKTAATGDIATGNIQAFDDHEEYQKTLEEVLNEDTRESWNPNDPILD